MRVEDQEILSLKKSMSETNRRLEELNNKFLLLQEKVETNAERLVTSRSGFTVASSVSVAPVADTPPAGLKVVKLKDVSGGSGTKETKQALPTVTYTNADLLSKEPKMVISREPVSKPASKPALAPEVLYQGGVNLFIAGRYAEARTRFVEIVKHYPDNQLSDNTLYWIGESFYTEGLYSKALLHFSKVTDKYPEGNKAPDAMLKTAYSLIELGEKEKAILVLRDIAKLYPDSGAALKAEKRLKNL